MTTFDEEINELRAELQAKTEVLKELEAKTEVLKELEIGAQARGDVIKELRDEIKELRRQLPFGLSKFIAAINEIAEKIPEHTGSKSARLDFEAVEFRVVQDSQTMTNRLVLAINVIETPR